MPRKKTKYKIITVDCETDPFEYGEKVYPFNWGVYDGEHYYYFWNDDPEKVNAELIECLRDIYENSHDEKIIVYAHNGGKFDFLFLKKYFDPEILIINGRVAKATLFEKGVELRDSYLLIPVPLASFDKDDIDYMKMKKDVRHLHKDEIIRYLRKDVVVLHDVLSVFIDRFGLNLTLASTALKEIKKTGYEVARTNEKYDSVFRQFYFGGRVQCIKTGSFYGDYIFVDINSAYPYAMIRKHWYGRSYIQSRELPTPDKNGSWFAHIVARSRGALPYRADKLYFPDDDEIREYFASGWEINAGLETGTLEIIEVKKVLRPTLLEDFSTYIGIHFKEKAEAKARGLDNPRNQIDYTLAKLLQNSGYGKFAQDGRDFKKFIMLERGDWPDDPDYKFHSDVEGFTFFCKDDPQDLFFNTATAASITGFVRAYLWKAICESEEPLYCDTDSLICKKFVGKLGDELGAWGVEMKVEEAHIAARKIYAVKGGGKVKTACKGAKLSFDEIKSGVESGKIIEYFQAAPVMSFGKEQQKLSRKISFENIEKNSLQTPLDRVNMRSSGEKTKTRNKNPR